MYIKGLLLPLARIGRMVIVNILYTNNTHRRLLNEQIYRQIPVQVYMHYIQYTKRIVYMYNIYIMLYA